MSADQNVPSLRSAIHRKIDDMLQHGTQYPLFPSRKFPLDPASARDFFHARDIERVEVEVRRLPLYKEEGIRQRLARRGRGEPRSTTWRQVVVEGRSDFHQEQFILFPDEAQPVVRRFGYDKGGVVKPDGIPDHKASTAELQTVLSLLDNLSEHDPK